MIKTKIPADEFFIPGTILVCSLSTEIRSYPPAKWTFVNRGESLTVLYKFSTIQPLMCQEPGYEKFMCFYDTILIHNNTNQCVMINSHASRWLTHFKSIV